MRLFRRRSPPRLFERLADSTDPVVRLLLHDAGGPAMVVDRRGEVVCANQALAQLLDREASRVIGGGLEDLFAVGSRQAAWDAIAPILLGRVAEARQFVTMLAGSPVDHPMRVTVLPLSAPDGGALLRFADITEQKQLEAQLAHSQKLQATGQLAGGIAHDFNNLLTAILGAADEILAGASDAGILEDAGQIRGSAQRGAALVRQLLAFGRQQALQPRSLAVNDVIEDVSGLLRRLLGSQMRLELALEQPGRMVRADPSQLDQVLINLAVNARDAMQGGGVLTLRSGHITLFRPLTQGGETIPPGRYVMIEVQDTGGGIAPEILPRIFDPFFTTRRDRGGSGLGLSTVHGIVRQSEGFLAVESELGRGTSMRIYLPRWDDGETVAIPRVPSRLPVAGPASKPVPPRRGTVLLVDDEDPVRKLAERALTRAGFTVIAADSGESAMAALRHRPDWGAGIAALVTDLVMPGMDGAGLLREMRAYTGRPQLPAILVSGYAETPLRQGLGPELQHQAAVFLPKPYSLAELVTALDGMLAETCGRTEDETADKMNQAAD